MITSNECFLRQDCCRRQSCPETFCQKLYSINLQYDLAQLSEKQKQRIVLKDPSGEDTNKYIQLHNIQNDIIAFVKGGYNLYLSSVSCGTGKTSWALKLLQAYIGRTWAVSPSCRALFINVPRFFTELKMSFDEDRPYINNILENIQTADLVVWDEVGIKGLTSFEAERLFNYLNLRLDYGKSNIYTSNLSAEELEICVGPRLYSRIINQSINITFTGADHRKGDIPAW